jgi:hypothetical protein
MYIDRQQADLYGDEEVWVVKSLFIHSKIDAAIGDFTQSFTLPSTPNNDAIFKHWYDIDVFGGFNPSFGVDAILELNGAEQIVGKLELQGVQMRDGIPENYKVQFYGASKVISAELGEKNLSDFDWDYDITADYTDYSTQQAAVNPIHYWPIAFYERARTYGDGFPGTGADDINNPAQAIAVTELRPAFRLNWMVDKVMSFAGYDLEGDFITDTAHDNLYCLPMEDSGSFKYIDELANEKTNVIINSSDIARATYQTLDVTSAVFDPNARWSTGFNTYTTTSWGKHTFQIKFNAGKTTAAPFNDDVQIYIRAKVNGVVAQAPQFWFIGAGGTGGLSGGFQNAIQGFNLTLKSGDVVTFEVAFFDNPGLSDAPFFFNGNIFITEIQSLGYGLSIAANQLMPPDVSAVAFLQGVLSTFNLRINPGSTPNAIRLDYFDDWIGSGSSYAIDDVVDFGTVQVEKVGLSANYLLSHEPSEQVGAVTFRNANNRSFGDMAYSPEVDFPNSNFEIKTPFCVLPWQEMRTRIANAPTGCEFPYFMDVEFKPKRNKLTLFYKTQTQTLAPHYIRNNVGTAVLWAAGWSFRPFSKSPIDDSTRSIAFSLESPPTTEPACTDSLFQRYWQNTVESFFGANTRRLMVEGYMDVDKWTSLNLNDTVYLRDNPFKVESISYEMTSGKFKATLITFKPDRIPRVISISTVGVVTADLTLRASDAKRLNLYNGQSNFTQKPLTQPTNVGVNMTTDYINRSFEIES